MHAAQDSMAKSNEKSQIEKVILDLMISHGVGYINPMTLR